jgi:hypothetical protein
MGVEEEVPEDKLSDVDNRATHCFVVVEVLGF